MFLKLLIIPVFILVALGLIKLGKFMFKVVDDMEVKETKGDIEHKAELTEDVERYSMYNGGKISKAKSDSVEKFNNYDKK